MRKLLTDNLPRPWPGIAFALVIGALLCHGAFLPFLGYTLVFAAIWTVTGITLDLGVLGFQKIREIKRGKE